MKSKSENGHRGFWQWWIQSKNFECQNFFQKKTIEVSILKWPFWGSEVTLLILVVCLNGYEFSFMIHIILLEIEFAKPWCNLFCCRTTHRNTELRNMWKTGAFPYTFTNGISVRKEFYLGKPFLMEINHKWITFHNNTKL